jgi:outer membrane protein assembly factor BamB
VTGASTLARLVTGRPTLAGLVALALAVPMLVAASPAMAAPGLLVAQDDTPRGGNLTNEEIRQGDVYGDTLAVADLPENYDYRSDRTGAPAAGDGHVYAFLEGWRLSDEGGQQELVRGLFAFDGRTMEPVWQFNTTKSPHSRPIAVGDTVYIVTEGGTEGPEDVFPYNLHAIDSETGEERWRQNVGGIDLDADIKIGGDRARFTHRYCSEPVCDVSHPVFERDGLVYTLTAAAGPQAVVAFDAETGEEVWRFDGVVTEPELDDGLIYAGNTSGDSYGTVALDAETGAVEWSYQREKRVDGRGDEEGAHWIRGVGEERVYVVVGKNYSAAIDPDQAVGEGTGNEGSPLYALDAETGDPDWTFATDDGTYAHEVMTVAGESDTVLVDGATEDADGSSDGYVFALDTETGDVRYRWGEEKLNAPDYRWRTRWRAGSEYVYFSVNNNVTAYELGELDENPDRAWRVTVDEMYLNTDPDLYSLEPVDGRLHVFSETGGHWAYDPTDGTLLYNSDRPSMHRGRPHYAFGEHATYVLEEGLDDRSLEARAPIYRSTGTEPPPATATRGDGQSGTDPPPENADETAVGTVGDQSGPSENGPPGDDSANAGFPFAFTLGVLVGFVGSLVASLLVYIGVSY